MNWVIQEIENLKKKMNSKTHCIAFAYDEYGDGEGQTLIYKSHKVDEDGDEVKLVALSSDGLMYLDGFDASEYIKQVMIVKKTVRAKLKKMHDYKAPTNAKRHVGIELEFISKLSKPELMIKVCEAGIEDFLTIKDDGSINTEDDFCYSHEVCILATEDQYLSVVNRLCKVLSKNSTVNKSCGMHVHIDMRSRNVDMAYAALFEAQPILYAMCPKSRRTGEFAQIETEFKAVSNDQLAGRYFGINKSAYKSHKTLEVRVHSGTLIASKIANWVRLLLKIVDNKKTYDFYGVKPLTSLSQFKKQTKIRGKLAKYIDQRVSEFKKDQTGSKLPLGA